MNECRCGRPTRDEAYCCDDCLQSLSVALGEVPWLDEELEVTISGQKGATYNGNTSRGAERPSPVHWGASEARGHLKALLVSWALFSVQEGVRNQSPQQELPTDDLVALSRWLLWRVDGLGLHDIGPEAVDEITSAVAHCHRLIDRPADKLYAGRCTGDLEEDGGIIECPEDLWVRVGSKDVTCRRCGTSWDVSDRRKWLLDQAEEVLATAVEISRAVSWLGTEPLTADRVRQWATRDRIITRGHDRTGRPLYRVGDAIDLLAKSATKGAA